MDLRKRLKDMLNGSVIGGMLSAIIIGAEMNIEEPVVLGLTGLFVSSGLTIYRLRNVLPGSKSRKSGDLQAKQLLKMILQNGGKMTLTEAVMMSDQNVDEVEALMENLQQKGMLNVSVSGEGAVMFEIPRAASSHDLLDREYDL